MNTLERQLEVYGDHQRELHGPITPDELVARGPLVASEDTTVDSAPPGICEACGADLTVFDLRRPMEEATPASPKRRTMVAGAVAAAIVFVVGLVVVADRPDGSVVTGTASLPSVEDSEPASVDDSVPASVDDCVPAGERSGVAEDQSVFGGPNEQIMSSVTVGGPGLVAVGSDSRYATENLSGSAAVWTSVDGSTWSRVTHDEAIFGSGGARMLDVTTGGPGVVAVGGEGGFWSWSDAVVWTSIDGLTWSRVAHGKAACGGGG